MKIQRTLKIAFWIVGLLGAVFIYNAIAIYRFSQEDQTRIADCAIVAGASVTGERPSPVFQARLDHALWLYQHELTKALILTGGYSRGSTVSDAAIARRYLVENGVPDRAIFIEEHSTVTHENILYAKQILKQQQWRTALLVSDPLHMLRLKMMAHDSDIESWSSPTQTSRYQSGWTKAQFLLRESFYYSGYRIYRLLPVQNNSIID